MTLLFTGTVPWWLIALLFVLSSALTIIVYRKHTLAAPWHWALPSMRIAAIALLLLTLLQPVLSKEHSSVTRGRIPVIVDNSGSMSIVDRYTPSEQVVLGWQFRMFPRERRCVAYAELAAEAAAWTERFSSLVELANRIATHTASDRQNDLKRFQNQSKTLRADLLQLRKQIADATQAHSYMQAVTNPSDDQPKTATSIEWERFTTLFDRAAQLSEKLSDEAHKEQGTTSALIKTTTDTMALWRQSIAHLPAMQRQADSALAGAQIADVDSALERIAEMTRMDWNHFLLQGDPAVLDALRERGQVDVFSLDEPLRSQDLAAPAPPSAPLASTRIGSVINDVLNHYEQQPIAAVVLLSDGNSNSGKPLADVRQVLHERDIPLVAVGIGRQQPPPDVAIERVIAPRTAFRDDKVNLHVKIRRHGLAQQPLQLTVRDGNTILKSHVMPADGNASASVDLSFVESREGMHQYQVRADLLNGETLDNNNEKSFRVSILTDPIRALLIDEFPRWESRYANMMLTRDKRVQLHTIFADTLDSKHFVNGAGGYPANAEQLFAYDVVVLGDVSPQRFTSRQLGDLHRFVVDRGGTMILMAGPHHMPSAFQTTALNGVLPVYAGSREGNASLNDRGSVEIALGMRPTVAYDEVIQIGSHPGSTRELWRKLPGMNWVKSGVRPTESADFLVATTPQEWPVVLEGYAGLGKVLYLGSDSFWRWRYRARWTYHHRFWGQVLLWAIRGRTSGADRHVKLMSDRAEYAPGETVRLRARIFGENGQPLVDAAASAEIYNDADELVKLVQFVALEASGGEYRAEITDLPRGNYRAVPKVAELPGIDINVECPFPVRDLPTSEYVELALHEPALKSIATTYLPMHDAAMLTAHVPKVEITREHRRDIEIWDTFYLMALVALLLGCEWQLRKQNKLV